MTVWAVILEGQIEAMFDSKEKAQTYIRKRKKEDSKLEKIHGYQFLFGYQLEAWDVE